MERERIEKGKGTESRYKEKVEKGKGIGNCRNRKKKVSQKIESKQKSKREKKERKGEVNAKKRKSLGMWYF